MKIGYACIPLCIGAKTTRTFLLKNFNKDIFLDVTKKNLDDLEKILLYNVKNNIKLFRISSDIIPFGSHDINNVPWENIFKKELKNIGNIIKENNLRVSMHPGQYTVLNSTSTEVVKKSILDLIYHTKFLDSLDVNFSNKIILHVGGVYGNKNEAMKRFIDNFNTLPCNVKNRLVIENDEKSYTIDDVLYICSKIKIPAIFDNLHHYSNNTHKYTIPEILSIVNTTWQKKDGNMKIHYSNQDPYKKPGAHSNFLYTRDFIEYYKIIKTLDFDIDIMLEVKNKDISAIKAINILNSLWQNEKKSTIYDQWAKYKYNIMERNYNYYKQCSKLIKEGSNLIDFYILLDSYLIKPIDKQNFLNTLMHVNGYFKKLVTSREKSQLNKYIKDAEEKLPTEFLLNNPLLCRIKAFILKLSEKYEVDYIKSSYYFYH